MQCSACGKQLIEGETRCDACGTDFNKDTLALHKKREERKRMGSRKLSNFFLCLAAALVVFGGYLYQYDLQSYEDQQSKIFSGFAVKKTYNVTDIQGYEFVHDKIYKDSFIEHRTRDQFIIGIGLVVAMMGVVLRKRETA